MKKLLWLLMLPGTLLAQNRINLTTTTAGVLRAPTNFFVANSNLLSQAIAASSGASITNGSISISTNLLITAVPSATIGGTNLIEGVNQDGTKVFQMTTNGQVHFGVRQLRSSAGPTIDWENKTLGDGDGNVIVNWLINRTYDSSAIESMNWQARALIDSTTANSVDWQNRHLVDSNGVVGVNWSNKTTAGAWAFTGASLTATNGVNSVSSTATNNLAGLTVVSNLTVNGTQTVATANVTNLVLINPFDISLGTNANYNAHTNIWTANTPFILGQTNYYLSSGAATLGITGIGNLPTTGARFGELYIKATGDITFTNVAIAYKSDGATSRTITNGNLASISIHVIAGFSTNLVITKSW